MFFKVVNGNKDIKMLLTNKLLYPGLTEAGATQNVNNLPGNNFNRLCMQACVCRNACLHAHMFCTYSVQTAGKV